MSWKIGFKNSASVPHYKWTSKQLSESEFQNIGKISDIQIAITFDSLDRFWSNKQQNASNVMLYQVKLFMEDSC